MANVLILGCTSAVASAIAERMAASGDRLYLVGRSSEKLKAVAVALGSAVVGVRQADFNETDQAASVIAAAFASLGRIDKVLIAHGDLGDQLRSEADFSHARHVINTNYLSVVALLIPLVERVREQGSCKIAVIGSVAGDRGRPRNFTYGSAKGALQLYLQGLRSVLYGSGVEIYSFKLGPVDSPMTIDHKKNFSFTTVERAARAIHQGMAGKRYTRYVPGYWFWVMLTVRWLPESLFQRLGFLSDR